MLDYTSEELEDASSLPIAAKASGHVIKVVQGGASTDICIYLSLKDKSKFVFLNPVVENKRMSMEHLTTLDKSTAEDLVDFVVTEDYLMSLWTTQTGDTQMLTTPLDKYENSSSEWEPVLLTASQDYVVVPQHRDPRDVYVEKIFAPGYFSPYDIIKALSVYRRCAAATQELDSLINMSSLKEDVINAVHAEICNCASEYEGDMQEEAYTQLQLEQWEKLYSCCYQYKQVGEKFKGLFADPITGLFAVIKKNNFSVLRPCDTIEELYLSPTIKILPEFLEKKGLLREGVSSPQFIEDVKLICDAVRLVGSQISHEDSCMFQSRLQTLESPEILVEILRDSISNDQNVTTELTDLIKNVSNPVYTVETLFYILELSDELDPDVMDGLEPSGHQHYSHLFSGALGLSIITQAFQQLVSLRFKFVRDLTVVLSMASSLRQESGLSQPMMDAIMNELLPKGADLLRCYKLLLWASEALNTVSPNNTLDFNLRQLSSLEITDNNTSSRLVSCPSNQSMLLMQMFVEGVGGEEWRRRLSIQGAAKEAVWREDLKEILMSLCLLIWPATDDTIFPEFLVRTCQYLRLEEYIHILTPWCTWNEGSRAFFLGLCHLHFDEPQKAVQLFVEASDGVATETFLSQRLLQTEETDHYRLQILYYLKIIKQLEEHGLPDLVITMATEAINKADKEDPNLPTLLSKVFKQHLELGHNQEAFAAMMSNPDTDRRKDCLRQFLVVLCENGNLGDLVSFDYQDLEEEVVYILENRARSVDLFTYDYYKLLFSFFIHREDYRKAGKAMFERGLRLSQEVPGLKSLQQQAQCYLSTLNCLRLVRPEYAWIVKPVIQQSEEDEMRARRVPKHGSDGKSLDIQRGPRKMEILELADLERDYLLLDARLRLIRSQADAALISGPMSSKEEILSLLCSAGLYDLAVSVTRTFSMSPETVLSSLSLRCVTLTLSSASYLKFSNQDPNSGAWQWLRENNIPPCGAKENTAADQAWSLLQSYVSILEDGSGVCHKCVAHTLLSQSFHLPTWLIHSFKVLDVAALLRVYLSFDLLSEAASLAKEYLDVVTGVLVGVDGPAFNLKGIDKPSPLCIWVPYTCLDQLLVALRDNDNGAYISIFQELKDKIEKYQEKSLEMSQSITAQ